MFGVGVRGCCSGGCSVSLSGVLLGVRPGVRECSWVFAGCLVLGVRRFSGGWSQSFGSLAMSERAHLAW